MYVNKATVHFYTVDSRNPPSSKCQISSVVWKMRRRSLVPAVNEGGCKSYLQLCQKQKKVPNPTVIQKQTKNLTVRLITAE